MEYILNSNFDTLENTELENINGGFVLFSFVVAGVTYEVTAAAAIVAGVYGISCAIGKGWAHVKNRQ